MSSSTTTPDSRLGSFADNDTSRRTDQPRSSGMSTTMSAILSPRSMEPGNRTQYDVDPSGLVARVVLPDGSTWSFEYDASDRLTRVSEPRGSYNDEVLQGDPIRHEFRHDAAGVLVEEIRAANTAYPRRTTYCRSETGLVVSWRDALGRRLNRCLDERGLTLSEELVDKQGTVVSRKRYRRHSTGELSRLSSHDSLHVRFDYNSFGDLRSVSGPDGTNARVLAGPAWTPK